MSASIDHLKLVDLLYEAALDPDAWAAALTAIADALGARAMNLTIADPEHNQIPLVVAPRTAPEWLQAYFDRWAASNVVRQYGTALPLGEVYDFERLGMPRSEFDRTPFYNEFCAPQRMNFALIMNAARDETAVSAVGFYRSTKEGPFAPHEERLLQALGPHVQRAVALNLKLARTELQQSGMVDLLNRSGHGALLVDAQARVSFANRAAEAMLREGTGLRTSSGRLVTRAAATTAALHSMIANRANGCAAGTLALPGSDGARLIVEVIPVQAKARWLPQRPAAMVFLENRKTNALPSIEEIRQMFDLTPAQAALARELLNGDGIPASAARLGISRSTARTQLLELFQKTGTNRQAELVRVILQHKPDRHPDRSDAARALGGQPLRGTISGCLVPIGAISSWLLDTMLGSTIA